MIKLDRAARLWNGPGLRAQMEEWGYIDNKLADGVLNRLYVKGDFANTNQHSLTMV